MLTNTHSIEINNRCCTWVNDSDFRYIQPNKLLYIGLNNVGKETASVVVIVVGVNVSWWQKWVWAKPWIAVVVGEMAMCARTWCLDVFCSHGGETAGQSSVFTMSRWSCCVSLWVGANKKAHLTHDCWDAFVLYVLHEDMVLSQFTNGFKQILFYQLIILCLSTESHRTCA